MEKKVRIIIIEISIMIALIAFLVFVDTNVTPITLLGYIVIGYVGGLLFKEIREYLEDRDID